MWDSFLTVLTVLSIGLAIIVAGFFIMWIVARVVAVSAARGWKKEMGAKPRKDGGNDHG